MSFGAANAAPGLIIKNGVVTELGAEVTTNFNLFGVAVSTDAGNGLNFEYDTVNEQFEMYGGLSVSFPPSGSTALTAKMGTSADDPGLTIIDGELEKLNLTVTGNINVYGLALGANGAGVKWVKGATAGDDTLEIYGDLTADFEVFQTNLQLGTDSKHPGITIKDGKFVVDAVKFELENANLGIISLNDLSVSYTAVGDSFDLDVQVNVGLPGGWTVGGGFGFVEGRFDSISLLAQGLPGIAIPGTGLFVTEVEASVKNIRNPSRIVVSGRVDLVYGETIPMLGKDVNLFHAEGQFTVDADEFVLECDVELGAYTTDNGNTWKGVLGQADGKLTLDWHDNLYSLHVDADGVLGFFDIEGDLVFAPGKDIQLLADAEVVVPDWVPFIGGDKLGGFGFLLRARLAATGPPVVHHLRGLDRPRHHLALHRRFRGRHRRRRD